MKLNSKHYLLFLSFLEGGSVMACELIGAKLLAPYFGTSLYIWAAALALTLGGLTSGYYLGGILSKKYSGSNTLLYKVLIAAGVLLCLMPFTSEFIMEKCIGMSLEMGSIISLLIFMFPPLVFMGMTSPIIINLLTEEVDSAGNSAGNVYAISTLGGISLTFLMGFYVIPEFGLQMPAIIVGLILALFPMVSLLSTSRKKEVGIAGLLLLMAVSLSSWTGKNYTDEYKVLYQSEGILGQVKVVDHPSYEITEDARTGRALIVNNTLQTYVGLEDDMKYSIWSWSHYFPTAASIFPKGSKVLLLGLGGGTLVKQLERLGFDTDVVEIDRRVHEVSVQYFNMNPDIPVIIDDARHYIKTTPKKYDIIIFDTFLSESVPEHLLTIEGFEDTKRILKPSGMIMCNFYGFIKGNRGRAARSVYKTFTESGFTTEILATPGTEYNRNLIFLASFEKKDFDLSNYEEPNYPKIEDLYSYFIEPKTLDLSEAKLLSDAKPQLSKLYSNASREWKRSYNAYYRKHFYK
ncbi:MAG: fused MFS/spermidine synthase [Bacteroidia bacterium]|nr:fused MFS/spermidine synthase [Bacteroidia bacterium]